MLEPVRLHLLPPAVGAILAVTAIPVEVGMGGVWTAWPTAGDLVANLLLFLPLGAALSRQRTLAVLAIAFAFSCSIELMQHWSVDRYSSPFDVMANTLSGWAGAALWRALRKSHGNAAELFTVGRFGQAALAAFGLAVAAAWSQPGVSSAVAGWDPSYAVLLGNERTGQRSWEGVIDGFALVPRALDRAAAARLGGTATANWREVIPEATLLDTQRHSLGQDTPLRLPQEAATDFAARATAANAFTIAARVEPASLRQSGPARILSFSWDPFHRNVDLGQERDRLVFRVRTPVSGENGQRFRVRTEPVLEDRTMTLVASYDGAVARVYVDGKLAARSNLAAAGCRVRALCDGGAHLAWTIMGAGAAVLAIAMLGARMLPASWAAGLAGGALLSAIAVVLGEDARIVPALWTPALPFVGALTVALAAQWAEKRAGPPQAR